jgi:hypothetical protein
VERNACRRIRQARLSPAPLARVRVRARPRR